MPVEVVTPVISVVIISYQREEEIGRVLDDIAGQHAAPPFEVVLVLQGFRTTAIEQITRAFGSACAVTLVCSNSPLGVYRARNAGIERSRGEIIAFLDDDCRIPRTWLADLLPFYEDPTVGGVGGYFNHPEWASTRRNWFYAVTRTNPRRFSIDGAGFHLFPVVDTPQVTQEADWLAGGNMSFRRKALEDVSGFDDAYGNYGFDDVDISLRVRRLGYRLISSHRLTVDHFPSKQGRDAPTHRVFEDERHRVLFARRAIGHHRLWWVRYCLRFIPHALVLTMVAVVQRRWRVPGAAIRGFVSGMREFSNGDG